MIDCDVKYLEDCTVQSLRECEHGEEELSLKHKTIVYKKKDSQGNFSIIKTFTSEETIKQVIWSDFLNEDDQNSVFTAVCSLEKSNLEIYLEDGNQYTICLPFMVPRILPSKNGLLIQRSPLSNESTTNNTTQLPLLFSLVHPLKDISPVIFKFSNTNKPLSFLTASDKYELIGISPDRSLCLFYNEDQCLHSIWLLRKASEQEINSVSSIPLSYLHSKCADYSFSSSISINSKQNNSQPYLQFLSSSPKLSPINSKGTKKKNSFNESTNSSINQVISNSPPLQLPFSPLRNVRLAPSPVTQQPIRAFSPTSPQLIASTTCLPNHNESVLSPQKPTITSQYKQFANLGSTRFAQSIDNDFCDEVLEPIYPELCLEQIWNETNVTTSPKASKVFLTNDFNNINYFVFVIEKLKQAKLVRFDESNDKQKLIFGTSNYIIAKDAEPIPSLSMILVLDANDCLILYSGLCKISFVNLKEISNMNTSSSFSTHEQFTRLSLSKKKQNNLSVYYSDLTRTPKRFRDSIRNSVYLVTEDNKNYLLSFPPIYHSSIVKICLNGLKNVLPRDTSMQMFINWYKWRTASLNEVNTVHNELTLFKCCILKLCGYDIESLPLNFHLKLSQSTLDLFSEQLRSPRKLSKKSSISNINQIKDDWEFICNYYNDVQQIPNSNKKRLPVQSNALLFPFLNYVLFCFHLTIEEIKLDTLMMDLTNDLIDIIYLLSVDIGLDNYIEYYGDQLTKMVRFEDEISKISKTDRKMLLLPTFFNKEPPCVFDYVQKLISMKSDQQNLTPFPYILETTPRIRYVILVYRAFKNDYFYEKNYLLPIGSIKHSNTNEIINLRSVTSLKDKIVLCISKLGLTKQDLETLPCGISIPLWDAIFHTKKNPPAGWSNESYSLISRDDLVALDNFDNIRYNSLNKHYTEEFDSDPDGFSNINKEILKLLFPKDQRVFEAYNMLISSKPVRVSIQQRVGMSDQDFMDEQEKHLYNLSIRTIALSVGRGMLTMRTYKPIIAETFPISSINMNGRVPPRNTVFSLRNNEIPAEMTTWPLFHNGVAAGLRVRLSESNAINSTWIIFNKPKIRNEETAIELQNQHAGFLLALGLNGYISQLSMMNIHDYLCMGNELTRVGVLLGLAAAKRGTMDLFAVKILSIHVEALLPPTSTELDVPPVAEVAAILGIGLLYQGSGQRHISEVLLNEISRMPGPEMEHCVDRESYALAAGLALGLVTLGKGNEMTSVASAWSSESTSIEDQLCNYMIGGHKRPQTAYQREKYRTPSYQIREGDYVNTDVTSPGATLALGMMFFRTNNQTVANWFVSPDTQHLLDSVRPDFLLLRTLSKGLILWDSIEPSKEWIDSHVPQIVAENALRKPEDNSPNYPRIDYETMSQAYCNIITGACMALSLKFAGSANEDAFRSIMFYTKRFIKLSSQSIVEQAGRSTIESCINVLVLSLSTVMAGTGNIEVMRICRFLRSRTNQTNLVLYGSHLATHMSLGLLFLGGCRYTLSTSPQAIAAMICAFFPKFPITSNDNRYHLQAFRHLYVLAAEPRLVIPRDIATGKYVYVHLNLKYKKSSSSTTRITQMRAPCFLPELDQIDEITISDNRYWNITFNKDKNWNILKKFLVKNGILYVKQKVGCLPYDEDPQGFKSIHSQCIMKEIVNGWILIDNSLSSFSSDPIILNFTKMLLIPRVKIKTEAEIQHKLAILLFDCAANETVDCLPALISLIESFYSKKTAERKHTISQLKLLTNTFNEDENNCEFIRREFFEGLRLYFDHKIGQNE